MGKPNPQNLKPYKKGQSGNPKGKPRGRKNLSTIVRGFLDARMPLEALGPKQAERLKALLGDELTQDLSIRDLLLLRQIAKGLTEGALPSTDYILKAAGEFKDELNLNLQQGMTEEDAMRVLERARRHMAGGGGRAGTG